MAAQPAKCDHLPIITNFTPHAIAMLSFDAGLIIGFSGEHMHPSRLPRRSALLVLVCALAAGGAGCAFFGDGITVDITQEQLQTIAGRMFPAGNGDQEAGTTVTLSNPTVSLPAGGDRIGFALDISVVVQLEPGEGPLADRAAERRENNDTDPDSVGGRARSKAANAAAAARTRAGEALQEAVGDRVPTTLTGTVGVTTGIRYDNDKGQIFLDGVNIDQLDINELPQRFNQPVTRLSSAAITRALQETPIHTIDEATTIGNIADTLLRDITIADGVLRITIGVG